ncbi:MAG: arylamine N-acetyltransferase [Peptococcaceae bacterium]|nr:arylamine N-acetyltransferase [Peptococcaceae bacterium]
MNVKSYLKRIKMEHRGNKADHTLLSQLQKQHMLTVPFENLDIIQGKRITLNVEDFFHKIVENRRGGFCYELNGLFHWLLKELGFNSCILSAQVKRADGTFEPEYDHMMLLVHLDKDYVVDVGFGNSVRSPLPLSGEEINDVSGVYRIKPNYSILYGYFFQKKRDGKWVSLYHFTKTPRSLSNFQAMCDYHQTSPDSDFTQKLLCTMATEIGHVTLSGETLTITEGGMKRVYPISSLTEREQILSQYFGITLP